MKNIYFYVEKNLKDECIKYGIKLSEYSDKIIDLNGYTKKGIAAYLTPKDSDKFDNLNYVCLRISTIELNVLVYNKICEDSQFLKENNCKLADYFFGKYEEPVCLICSSILPENIFLYNKVIDYPILIENSKEFYYEKKVNEFIQQNMFTSQELYESILDIGMKKGVFKLEKSDNNLDIYITKTADEKYIKKSDR